MILLQTGTNGPLGQWSTAVLAAMVRETGQDPAVTVINTTEDLASVMLTVGTKPVVARSDQPTPLLMAVLTHTKYPYVVVQEDIRRSVEAVISRGLDLANAVRQAASGLVTALERGEQESNVFELTPERAKADPVATAHAMARHYGLVIAAEKVERVVRGLPETQRMVEGSLVSTLDKRARDVIDGALSYFLPEGHPEKKNEITWWRELFVLADENAAPAVKAVDLTGRSRIVIYGPYVAMPAGSWSARVVLGFSKEAAGMPFLVDAFSDQRLAQMSITPDSDGIFEVLLSFQIPKGAHNLLQIRIQNERAAFDGRIALGYVALTPNVVVRSEGMEDLAQELGTGIKLR